MRTVIDQRIRRIEEILQDQNVTCMVAVRTEAGIEWNGKNYTDDNLLSQDVRAICGRKAEERPLVIIGIAHCRTDTE